MSIKKKRSAKSLPLVSQYLDMPLDEWQSRSCSIAALATTIGYWRDAVPDLRTLLAQAIENDAYVPGLGWRHGELAEIAGQYNLVGKNFDWGRESEPSAWKRFKELIKHYPVIVSIHKNFDPKKGGHQIIVSRIEKGKIYYNEPESKTRRGIRRSVSLARFRKGWKQRVIVVRPYAV